MKLFKFLLPLLSLVLISYSIFSLNHSFKPEITPVSAKNDFYTKLNNSLNQINLDISQITFRDYQNQIEFYIMEDNNTSKVLLSTQKDPYWQIASLQEVLKKSKIEGRKPYLIDLSIDNPYATFKNN